MVGRQQRETVDSIFKVLKSQVVILKNGRVLKRSDDVWKKASNKLNKRLNSDTLYCYVRDDWRGLKQMLIDHYTANVEDFKIEEVKGALPIIKNCELLLDLSIEFNETEWRELFNEKRLSKYSWTHKIFDKFFKKYKLPCAYSFKKGYVSQKTGCFKFEGNCNECGNFIKGVHSGKSEKYDFIITTHDSTSIKHFKKRPLSGTLRKLHQKELIYVKPLKYQRKLAKTTSKFGEVLGPLVYSSPVLRKARQSGIFKIQGVKPGKNVMDQLINMKIDPQWNDIIKILGEFPFHVVFFTQEQIELWKYVCSINDDITFSLDAAGRFIKSIKRFPSDTTSHIFLYVLSTSIKGKIYPLFQFVTEYHSANFLKHLLDQCIKSGAPLLKQITTDGSKALQNAISLSYNNCSYKVYLEECHEVAQGKKNKIPSCFIRTDIAHLIKAITRWNCFQKYDPKVKDFYIRIIGYLSTVVCYENYLNSVTDIFIVSQSPKFAKNSKVLNSIENLKNCIKFYKMDYCKENCCCDYCCEPSLETLELNKKFGKSIGSTKNKVLLDFKTMQISALNHIIQEKNQDDNEYYCIELVKNITVLFSEYPTWTNIMLTKFNTKVQVATSGRSEALFADLRHITNIHRPITAQLFIAQYVNDYVIGSMNTAMGTLKNDHLESPNKELVTNKKNKPNEAQKPRGIYLEKCLDIEERHSRVKSKHVKMLINANLEPPIDYDFNCYQFESSCMFDSIFELCASTYTNYSLYKSAVSKTCKNNTCFMKTVIDYLTNVDEKLLRLERLKHCLKHYNCDKGMLINKYDISQFIQQLFTACFDHTYYIKLERTTERKELLNVVILEKYLNEYLIKNKVKEVETCIYIDIQDFSSTGNINLRDLPERININCKSYLLSGAIGLKTSSFNENLKHYYAFCKSVKNNWSKKDDQAKSVKSVNPKNINDKICIIMYVTAVA